MPNSTRKQKITSKLRKAATKVQNKVKTVTRNSRRNPIDNGVPDNEVNKDQEKVFEEKTRPGKRKEGKIKETLPVKKQKEMVSFVEDGAIVELEVEGQATEFCSENEQEDGEVDSESEEEVAKEAANSKHRRIAKQPDSVNKNLNATASAGPVENALIEPMTLGESVRGSPFVRKRLRLSDFADECEILRPSEEELKRQEEEEMQKLVDFMKKKGLVVVEAPKAQMPSQSRQRTTNDSRKGMNSFNDNSSVVTIYKDAVPGGSNKRDSSSSEEVMDISDQTNKESPMSEDEGADSHDQVVQFITENPVGRVDPPLPVNRYVDDGEMPHASYQQPPVRAAHHSVPDRAMAQPNRPKELDKAEVMIQSAETRKATVQEVPGILSDTPLKYNSACIDEDYLLVGGFLDENLKEKIVSGSYVDFSKLMPKDKTPDEDGRMEMVNRGGKTYWVAASERENVTISSYLKWEQAFRVYSNVFSTFYPDKAGELIQYNHVIFTASQGYSWDNVYKYDREFRMHMARHHPHRHWGSSSNKLGQCFSKIGWCLVDKREGDKQVIWCVDGCA